MANWKKVIVSGSSAELASLNLDTALTVANGGTGAKTLTDGGVLLGSGTGAVTALGQATDGQLVIGSTGADPVLATLTGGSNITVTNGGGTISIAATGLGSGTVTAVSASGTKNGITLTSTLSSTTPEIKLEGTLGSIANSQLTNDSVSFGGVSVDLGSSDATPAFDLSDATSLPLGTGTTGTLATTRGGTGLTSYTTGDILYASSSNTLAKLGIGSNGQVLSVSSGGIVEWTTPTTGDITSIANATNGGLDVTNGTGPDPTLAIDINNLSAATVDVAADFIAFSDESAAGDPTKKESIADLVTAIAGTGLSATSGVLSTTLNPSITSSIYTGITGDVSITAAGVSSVNSVQANSVALGTDTTGNYVESLANATNGGTTITNGSAEGGAATVALNINNLSAGAIASADTIAFSDANDSNTVKKESVADVATLFAGTGLTATSAVIAVDYGSAANTAAEGDTGVTFSGTANEIELSSNTFTTVGGGGAVTIGLPNDVTIANNLTVANNAVISGDLRVSGTASFTHSDNLDIADKFITLASGSTTSTDGGIIVAQQASGATQIGEAFGFNDAAGGVGRWGVTSSLSNSSGAIVPLDYMVTVRTSTAVPVAAPKFGGATGYGNMHVDTDDGDIYIYA